MAKLPVIKSLHTAQPFTPAIGTGLSGNHQPTAVAPAIVSPSQAQPAHKATRPKK